MIRILRQKWYWKKVLGRFLYFFFLMLVVNIFFNDDADRSIWHQAHINAIGAFLVAVIFAFGEKGSANPGEEELEAIQQRGLKYYLGLFAFSFIAAAILGSIIMLIVYLVIIVFVDEPLNSGMLGNILIGMAVISLLNTASQWLKDRFLVMGRRNEPNL